MICFIFFLRLFVAFLFGTSTLWQAHTQKILQVADLWLLTQAKTHILRVNVVKTTFDDYDHYDDDEADKDFI